ncbi:hypothetical protein JW711_00615 [Candidatus Woesearchaeota archaeon]|nr:hypothetical protein [Candidatus Woesearchaeota archaeon]
MPADNSSSNMKCDVCGAKIETTFLQKVLGTYIRNEKGKKKLVCSQCQKNGRIKELK